MMKTLSRILLTSLIASAMSACAAGDRQELDPGAPKAADKAEVTTEASALSPPTSVPITYFPGCSIRIANSEPRPDLVGMDLARATAQEKKKGHKVRVLLNDGKCVDALHKDYYGSERVNLAVQDNIVTHAEAF